MSKKTLSPIGTNTYIINSLKKSIVINANLSIFIRYMLFV
jgi:hypothetical protein